MQLQLISFTRKDINWANKTIKGVYLNGAEYKRGTFRFPDAVYNRCYLRHPRTTKRLEKYIGKNKVFNRVTSFNKWVVYNILSPTDIKSFLPDTCLYNKEIFKKWLETYEQLILKPRYGCLGRNVYLAEKTKEGQFNIYVDRLKTPSYSFDDPDAFYEKIKGITSSKSFIIQKYIDAAKVENRISDIRILVQKNDKGIWKVTNGISRVAPLNYYSTNCSINICDMAEILHVLFPDESQRNSLRQRILNLSVKIAKLLDKKMGPLGEIGVDWIVNKEHELNLIEVNGKLQKKLYHMVSFKEIDSIHLVYQRPLEYALYLCNKEKSNK
ncbi:YheC/YheD family protein [Bacillus sp. B15-48]|uniref:YheC/YheD family protein n=1 Tax=Bacillus sp. B15-48 TaxID=1548601 RepID=UPI00193F4D81|nr:YheC/YheD family protein [Bacillus sp. B15-48]MBM4765361.1 hypothetical protein [Bacillus sp. B15-48]